MRRSRRRGRTLVLRSKKTEKIKTQKSKRGGGRANCCPGRSSGM